MQSNGSNGGQQLLLNESVRLGILKLLLDNPSKNNTIHNRLKAFTYIDIETELRLMMAEGILTARDKRFFIRNVPYARQLMHQDRRFGT